LIVTKGKTERCLNKFNIDKNKVIGTFTNSGWTNEDCIKLVLDQIAKRTNCDNSLLLLDQYSSHTTDDIKNYAKERNIQLLYIPIGLTSKYQPLDIKINGMLKNYARKTYSERLAKNPELKYSCSNCLNDLLENIKKIKKGIIISSFNLDDRSKSNK
jgi:hypothetical protein